MNHETKTYSAREPSPSIDDLIKNLSLEAHDQQFSQKHFDAMTDIDRAGVQDELMRSEIMDIIGVVIGIKPSAVLSYSAQLTSQIRDLGLNYHKLTDLAGNDGLTISRSELLAKKLVESFQELWSRDRNDRSAVHRDIGKMLGYPETSTDYFIKRSATLDGPLESQLPAIIPHEFESGAGHEFCQLIFSPYHWREELEAYSLPLELATRLLAPKSYRCFEREARRSKVASCCRKLIRKPEQSSYGPGVVTLSVK